MYRLVLFILAFLIIGLKPGFSEWVNKSGGEVTMEGHVFEDDNDSKTYDNALGMFTQLRTSLRNGPFKSVLRVNGRLDKVDEERNQVYLEEAWIGLKYSRLNLKVGSQLFNWSAAEAFHPADIMNSRNYDSNIENAEKIGEPTASLKVKVFNGNITLFYMPYYQKPIWPGNRSRLNTMPDLAAGITQGKNIYIDHDNKESDDRFGHQGAVRIVQNFSDFDFSLHTVYHIDTNLVLPVYDPVRNEISSLFQRRIQYGGTLQYAIGSFVLKSEAAYRFYRTFDDSLKTKYQNPQTASQIEETVDHTVVAVGIDYAFDLGDMGELTLLFEGQRIFGTTKEEREQLDIFQSDLLFGIRLSMNDVLDRSFLLTCIVDTERKYQTLLNINYSQRINDVWGFSLNARRVMANNHDDKLTGLEVMDDANQYSLNLSRYF